MSGQQHSFLIRATGLLSLLLVCCSALLFPTNANAAPSLTPASPCMGEVDVIFYVDNSGSVSDSEFSDMSTSIRSVIAKLMPAANGPARGAVVHYGSPLESWESNIYIERDFSSDPALVGSFTRHTGDLGIEDYAAESLILIGDALDGRANTRIISPQKTLNRRADVPLVVFFFTDALRYAFGSSVVLPSSAPDIFQPYNDFKRDRRARFISVVVPWDPIASADLVSAGAAISSVGGDYTGIVEANPFDPEGSGKAPRWTFQTSFILTTVEIDRIVTGICKLSEPALKVTAVGRSASETAWKTLPDISGVGPGEAFELGLRVQNTGNTRLQQAVVMDILPFVGDTGAANANARGSKWDSLLSGPPVVPAGVTISYSASRKPKRDELTPGQPTDSESPVWRAAIPANPGLVRSLKFDFSGLPLAPGQEVMITWPMIAPAAGFTSGTTIWNSAGATAVFSSSGQKLPAIESSQNGVRITTPPGALIGDRVWLDSDSDGIQDAAEPGVNGVRVDLYLDNGDGSPSLLSDTRISSVTTAGGGFYKFNWLPAGAYFLAFLPSDNYSFARQDATSDAADSDAIARQYGNGWVGMTPVTTLTISEQDDTWDAGLISRSGIPAVWAIARQGDGKTVIGGRFRASHGAARNNIARLNANGTLDTGFNPGTGFNGTVRCLAVLSDGRVAAGGEFTSYNGTPCSGFAILGKTGALATGFTTPSLADVRWLQASGSKLYVGGGFTAFGRYPRPGVARLLGTGEVDTEFNPGTGSTGTVYTGAILPNGNVLIGGDFTSFAGGPAGRVAALSPAGQLLSSTAFSPGSGANGPVFSITAYPSGQVSLTGIFTRFNQTTCNSSIRLNAKGQPEAAFLPSTLNVNAINASTGGF